MILNEIKCLWFEADLQKCKRLESLKTNEKAKDASEKTTSRYLQREKNPRRRPQIGEMTDAENGIRGQ